MTTRDIIGGGRKYKNGYLAAQDRARSTQKSRQRYSTTYLENVILGEGDNLLDASVLLEDVGEGVHASWMGHIFDVDVQDGPARRTIVHELDEMASVWLGLGLHFLRGHGKVAWKGHGENTQLLSSSWLVPPST